MKLRKLALGIASAAAAFSLAAATPASAQEDRGVTHAVKAPADYEFVTYYYWLEDCRQAGYQGQKDGVWTKWKCIDGSWIPGDDYELWVVYK
ncbi:MULTISPECIES: YSIRK-type signal peptide-containing protein [Streptomyces]|uniref:Uncharacterized protein n=1 Tax=Streptomyces chartreusis NRRL 3882 TaxID=1079985 RepID=A0A2N9BLK4_STRCX|nr:MULTISPECIES: YSIRK-type signal peptide-containing protein [Streptomyces]MYS88627.1 YSIRK-type signal peptide-containing protein [Streptomyces sp. SID5464]SOR84249.1 hypothetical protein SCNRRL3882_7694 [Streptomyces chartreusis NRRL 3882]